MVEQLQRSEEGLVVDEPQVAVLLQFKEPVVIDDAPIVSDARRKAGGGGEDVTGVEDVGVARVFSLPKQAQLTVVHHVHPPAFVVADLPAPDVVCAQAVAEPEPGRHADERFLPVRHVWPNAPLDEPVQRHFSPVVRGSQKLRRRPPGRGEGDRVQPGGEPILALQRLAFKPQFVEPERLGDGCPFRHPGPVAVGAGGVEVVHVGVQVPPHPVERPKRLVDAVLQIHPCHDFVGGREVAQVVGVVRFRLSVVAHRASELARRFGEVHPPAVAFVVVGGVALRHGVARGAAAECPAVVFVAEGVVHPLHVSVSAVSAADCGRAEGGDVAVVGEVLVGHRHVVGRQCVAAASGVACEGLEHAKPRAGGGPAAEFRGVDELPLLAHPPAVEQPTFVEEVCAFQKERAVFREPHLVRAEVQDEVVCDDLAKIGHQGHVERERISQAQLGVESAVVRVAPLAVAGFVQFGLGIRTEVGEQGNPRRRVHPLDAAKHTALVHHAILGRVQGVPHRFFPAAPHRAPNVHAPRLGHAFRQGGHPELAPRHPNLGGPAAAVDLALDFPNPVPCVVGPLGVHDEVVERPPRGRAEAHGVDAVVVGAEPNPKLV